MPLDLNDKTILVVDDDPDIVSAIVASLDDTGAIIETAGDGQTATTRIEEDEPDLIILDIMLPHKSGFLVLEKLRRNKPQGSKPLVIMITGDGGRRHRQYAESLGVDGYLAKPFRMDRLLEMIEKLLP